MWTMKSLCKEPLAWTVEMGAFLRKDKDIQNDIEKILVLFRVEEEN